MALILRIDVDRPYGRKPFFRHALSRFSSDFYLPRGLPGAGYLRELRQILEFLNLNQAPACVFFRQCTLPDREISLLLEAGKHEIGLHLEDSRTFESFSAEKRVLESYIGRPVAMLSKHGSGAATFGRRHHAPYEPEKYITWAQQTGVLLFLGNLEDPSIPPRWEGRTLFYPSAFWLEPSWRDTAAFPVQWLMREAQRRDIVVLIHPENVLADARLTAQLSDLVVGIGTTATGWGGADK